MADLPASKTQMRVANLFNLPTPTSYADASRALERAGLPADGLPIGETWRTAAKLTDAELMRKLGGYADAIGAYQSALADYANN